MFKENCFSTYDTFGTKYMVIPFPIHTNQFSNSLDARWMPYNNSVLTLITQILYQTSHIHFYKTALTSDAIRK